MNSIPNNTEYTFDASAQEITLLSPFDTVDEEQIIKITNLDTGAVIYSSDRRTCPISVSSGVITHTYDLTGMADTDALQIILDTGATGL